MKRPVPKWVGERAKQMPTILSHWDGLPIITLSKITSGARLLWIFDDFDDEQFGLFAHLTSDEAQLVFDTPSDEGLLERIRPTMRWRQTLVWRTAGRSEFDVALLEVPEDGDEVDFSTMLFSVAVFLRDSDADPSMAEVRAAAKVSLESSLSLT